jgi:hypothetical protein
MPVLLNPADPGLYRNQRGRVGADHLMAQDVGSGGRYLITSGGAAAVNGGSAALPANWRNVFNVRQPAFAFLFLAVVLILIHAHAGAHLSAQAGVGRGRK